MSKLGVIPGHVTDDVIILTWTHIFAGGPYMPPPLPKTGSNGTFCMKLHRNVEDHAKNTQILF